MGKTSRTKGKVGELEVVKMLKHIFPNVQRELDQFQESLTYDLKNTGHFKIQIKRRKARPAVEAMLQEAAEGVSSPNIPVLLIRGDNGRWLTVMYADDWVSELFWMDLDGEDVYV